MVGKFVKMAVVVALLTVAFSVTSAGAADSDKNRASYWGSDCIKIDHGTGSDTLTVKEDYSLVVLKSAKVNDVFKNVTAGTTLRTASGKDISHYILCKPTDVPTTTVPSTTTTEVPTTTTEPSSTTTSVPQTTSTTSTSTTTTAPRVTTTTSIPSSTTTSTTTTVPLPKCLNPGEEDPRGPNTSDVARPAIPFCSTPTFTG